VVIAGDIVEAEKPTEVGFCFSTAAEMTENDSDNKIGTNN
jgi:hypothetical protein